MKRIIVCGGRQYYNTNAVWDTLDSLGIDEVEVVAQGGALGADKLTREWARCRDVACETFTADWEQYGRAAGPIRNKQMLDVFKPDLVVAFPGGRGTANMVKLAREAGVEVLEVRDS